MSSLVRSCCAKAALATAITITATAVNPTTHTLAHHDVTIAYPSVGFSALTLASLETVLTEVDSSSPPSALAPVDSAADTNLAVAPAAATTVGDAVYDTVRQMAFWAGVALLPAWWIALPITFPIGYLVGQQFIYPAPPNSFDFMGLRTLSWLLCAVALPPLLAGEIFPARESSTDAATTPAASAARPSAASLTGPTTASAGGSAVEPDEPEGEDITGAVRNSKAPADPAAPPASAEAAEAAGAAISEERATVSPAPRGNSVLSRRATEDKQSHERSAATPHERKIRAKAASPTATGQTRTTDTGGDIAR